MPEERGLRRRSKADARWKGHFGNAGTEGHAAEGITAHDPEARYLRTIESTAGTYCTRGIRHFDAKNPKGAEQVGENPDSLRGPVWHPRRAPQPELR